MAVPDKYSAVWVSHSTITDFLRCPRAYYLKNIYKDPKTGRKIQLVSPALSLGSAVHEVIESLSVLPTNERFREPLVSKFEQIWPRFSGERGGFSNTDTEQHYKQRGIEMLQRVATNPGPLQRLSIKLKAELPQFWLSETENIILCGKLDWLEYIPQSDSVHIIDFKTSKSEEAADSLQLPIYYLLATRTQKRPVTSASYWYLAFAKTPVAKELPDLETAYELILGYAKQIKLARQLSRFRCPNGELGCSTCKPLERVIRGDAKLVGKNEQGRDLYLLGFGETEDQEDDSIIL